MAHPERRAAPVDDKHMVYFWNWGVRNPMFLVALIGLGAGAARIVEWPLALCVFTVGVLFGDAAWHVARKARIRHFRKLAEAAAASSNSAAWQRFTDYNVPDRENVA